jgi:hypothetical protein
VRSAKVIPKLNGVYPQAWLTNVLARSYSKYIDQLQKELDTWIDFYNTERTHQGKMCCGRTPMQTLINGKSVWAEKRLG